MTDLIKGQCLCGGVAFEVARDGAMSACHCRMCQRWTGSVFIDMDVEDDDMTLVSHDTLAWYDSSDWAKRGFCSRCGSSLFYRMKTDGAKWAVLAGTLDLPAGHTLSMEIFVDEKPDYFDLAGERPRLTAEETLARFGGTDT
ncbi:MAG: GFA family protein [Henriciella sp.]|uniref:GFA family protein n=1 Tax=Henriciella sp. TaxID=1968823 RepID=UPI003C771A46